MGNKQGWFPSSLVDPMSNKENIAAELAEDENAKSPQVGQPFFKRYAQDAQDACAWVCLCLCLCLCP